MRAVRNIDLAEPDDENAACPREGWMMALRPACVMAIEGPAWSCTVLASPPPSRAVLSESSLLVSILVTKR